MPAPDWESLLWVRSLRFEDALATLRALEKVMSDVVQTGFPAHQLRCKIWRDAEGRQRKAETLLMAMIHCFSERVANDNENEVAINIDWRNNKHALGDLIHRIRKCRDRAIPVMTIFSRVQAPQAVLVRQDLLSSNFSAANLESSWCYGAQMGHSNFSRTNFRGARLGSVSFMNSDLDRANLEHAHCNGVNFMHANLANANLRNALLVETSFHGANVRGAIFEGADLRHADLRKSGIKPTQLRGAKLDGALLPEKRRRKVVKSK